LKKTIPTIKGINTNGKSDISAAQGSSLAALLLKYNYNWNTSNKGLAISTDNKVNFDFSGYNIELLSPNNEKLESLKTFWKRELDKKKYNFAITDDAIFDDAFEFMLMSDSSCTSSRNSISSSTIDIESLSKVDASQQEIDKRPPNGSSIAFILKKNEKKLLFLGDSHQDIIIENIKKRIDDNYLEFDAVKIPHHGSNNNFSLELSGIIKSDKYLISTNGKKHGHPNEEVISKIVSQSGHKDIIFNYCHSKYKDFKDEEMNEKYSFKVFVDNEIIIND